MVWKVLVVLAGLGAVCLLGLLSLLQLRTTRRVNRRVAKVDRRVRKSAARNVRTEKVEAELADQVAAQALVLRKQQSAMHSLGVQNERLQQQLADERLRNAGRHEALETTLGEVRYALSREVRALGQSAAAAAAFQIGDEDQSLAPLEVPLPPKELRMGGEHFQDDGAFRERALRDALLLERYAGLTKSARLLDWGCGAGRLAVGIKGRYEHVADYHGVDVQKGLISWAQQNLADDHTRFSYVDLGNARYNPRGTDERNIPGADRSVDVFYAYSVFSHMLTAESAAYLREVRRLLAPGGRAMVTAFLEFDVPDCEENPEGYGPLVWTGALHCVRYDYAAFDALIAAAGLAIDVFIHGQETDGQSMLVLRRR